MTITREQLELAALAAGKRVAMAATGRNEFDAIDADALTVWRPHTDIADAARLAVKLKIDVVSLQTLVIARPKRGGDKLVYRDGTPDDMERAYCEAITLSAAEIGRRMKEAK